MNSTDKFAVATICTANYWPYTAVLIESLARVCPDWEIHVLALTDLPGAKIPANVHVIPAEELWGAEVAACRARFSLFEWACASKPRLLRHLLDNAQASLAIYADSDIEFFSAPESIARGEGSIILQPNVATAGECKGAAWDRLQLQYGTYNGGFLAVRNTDAGRAFLDWWDERAVRYSCTDPALDVFSDQRWLDMVPGLFPDVTIDRSLASNAAIWNIVGRNLRVADGRYFVGDEPLSFFHYHRVRLGMDVDAYFTDIEGHPAVRTLVRDYLSKAASHASAEQSQALRHDLQADGTAIPPIIYRAVRDAVAEGAFSIDPAQAQDRARESLRLSSFEHGRLRARVRTLSYHWAHAKAVISPDADADRYQRSAMYRAWVDFWFFVNGSRQAQLPENWALRSPGQRRLRKVLARVARAVTPR